MGMGETIARILCDHSLALPTEVYNEGWMPHLEAMDIGIISWEEILDNMESRGASGEYRDSYRACCCYASR